MPARKTNSGFVSPLSLIGLVFVTVALVITTNIVKNPDISLDIREWAKVINEGGSSRKAKQTQQAQAPTQTQSSSCDECSNTKECQMDLDDTRYRCQKVAGCKKCVLPTPPPKATSTPPSTPQSTCKGECLNTASCAKAGRSPAQGTCADPGQICCSSKEAPAETAVLNYCTKGLNYCVNETTLATCKADNSGYSQTTCEAGKKCSEGRCVTPAASPVITPSCTDECQTTKECQMDLDDTRYRCQPVNGCNKCVLASPSPVPSLTPTIPTKKPSGDNCSSNDECESGFCYADTEKEKTITYQPGSGGYINYLAQATFTSDKKICQQFSLESYNETVQALNRGTAAAATIALSFVPGVGPILQVASTAYYGTNAYYSCSQTSQAKNDPRVSDEQLNQLRLACALNIAGTVTSSIGAAGMVGQLAAPANSSLQLFSAAASTVDLAAGAGIGGYNAWQTCQQNLYSSECSLAVINEAIAVGGLGYSSYNLGSQWANNQIDTMFGTNPRLTNVDPPNTSLSTALEIYRQNPLQNTNYLCNDLYPWFNFTPEPRSAILPSGYSEMQDPFYLTGIEPTWEWDEAGLTNIPTNRIVYVDRTSTSDPGSSNLAPSRLSWELEDHIPVAEAAELMRSGQFDWDRNTGSGAIIARELPGGYYLIQSGRHRTTAAFLAGLEEITVQLKPMSSQTVFSVYGDSTIAQIQEAAKRGLINAKITTQGDRTFVEYDNPFTNPLQLLNYFDQNLANIIGQTLNVLP